MSCISKHHLDENSLLGVWKIEEDIETLSDLVYLNDSDRAKFDSFRSKSRKLEFLSVRALLRELIGPQASIVYDRNNKPYLKDGSHFISISHSNNLTAILLSSNERVGVDLEYMSANITAFAFKFLNRNEIITTDTDRKRYHLYIHWCAKEALYKICDKEGIRLRSDITIEPFDVANSGEITGRVRSESMDESFTLRYSRYENYTIVWTKKLFADDDPEKLKICSPDARR